MPRKSGEISVGAMVSLINAADDEYTMWSNIVSVMKPSVTATNLWVFQKARERLAASKVHYDRLVAKYRVVLQKVSPL